MVRLNLPLINWNGRRSWEISINIFQKMTFAVVLFTQFGMGTLHRRVESIVNICFSVNIVLVLL